METAGEQETGFTEVEHCWISMADGVRLSARLWLPKGCEVDPAPAILEYIPYRKADMVRQRDERNHDVFAEAGYACIRVDMRGSGNSEGVMEDMYTEDELDDATAAIEWIASQPWCNGNVGMMGTSWGGTASLQAATRRPHALKAVIAVCATDNRYEDDIHHMGGFVLTDSVEWGATLPAILALPPDPKQVGDSWREIWTARLEKMTCPLAHWIKEDVCNLYWQWGSVSHQNKVTTCPVLMVGGWADRYSNTVMNYVRDNPETSWGIVGPWGHHYPSVACPQPGIDFQKEAICWWDHWLRDIDNGTDQVPKLRLWMQEFQSPGDKIQERSGSWITESEWPGQNVHPVE